MFYDKYVELCHSAGKKPTPVAIELGFCSSNVAQWKKGSTPRPAALQKIADYFGVSQATLLGLDVNQKEKPATVGDGQDKTTQEILSLIADFSPEELALVKARIAKIKESR